MADKDFIRENIVGRKRSRMESFRHYLRVVFSAILFGVLGAAVFAAAEPVFRQRFYGTEPLPSETVAFGTVEGESGTAEVTETGQPPESSMPLEGSDPETAGTEEAGETEEEETTEETRPFAESLQEAMETYAFLKGDYEMMLGDLRRVSQEAEGSLVEVVNRVSTTDFLGTEMTQERSFSGLVLAETSEELLILTPMSAVSEANAIEVTIARNGTYTARLKGLDATDGFAVISVQITGISEKDLAGIREIPIGNSRRLQRGDIILAIGAPAGALYSSARGEIAYVDFREPDLDGTIERIRADIDADTQSGTFILNTAGELIGWITASGKQDPPGYHPVAGISDYIDAIERLSNGSDIPFLGMRTQEVTKEMERRGVPAGLYIQDMKEDSPAFAAGVQRGDVLIRLNETDIQYAADLSRALREVHVGDPVRISVLRQGSTDYTELEFTAEAAKR